MSSYFARWTPDNAPLYSGRLSDSVLQNAAALPEKRRKRYLSARSLLAEMMLRIYGISQLPEMTVTSSGRPIFVDSDLPDFSFSCAGNTVGVLLAPEGAHAGLDMEIVRAHSRQVLESFLRMLSTTEKIWLSAQNDIAEATTQLWTLRQSILKLTGESPTARHSSLRLQPGAGRLRSDSCQDVQALCDSEPQLVWSCALSPASKHLYLWEFDSEGGWRSLRDIDPLEQNFGPHTLKLTSMPEARCC